MTTLRIAAQAALEALANMIDAQSNPNRREFPKIYDYGKSRRAQDGLRAALAAEPQEPALPVAWWIPKAEQFALAKKDGSRPFAKAWEPLYAAPPQRRPLSDEQISDLWCEVSNTDFVTADAHVFARAIEAAHRDQTMTDWRTANGYTVTRLRCLACGHVDCICGVSACATCGLDVAEVDATLAEAADEIESLRADAARWQWLVRHACLGFDGAPSWNAVIRLPVFSSDDQTITALVDAAMKP